VELTGCDNLRELLKVLWLQIDDVESLDFVLQVPQVNSQVITGDEVLSVGAYRDRVDVVVVKIWITSF
jgi:hypothetical protein